MSTTMLKFILLLLVVVAAIFNGLHSPLLLLLIFTQYFWYPQFLPSNPAVVPAFASILLAVGYALVSGIPAALYERLFGNAQASTVSRLLWLLVMCAMSIPSLGNMLRWLGWA